MVVGMFTNDSGIFCLLKIVYTVESNLMYQESKQGDINLAIQKKTVAMFIFFTQCRQCLFIQMK